jgi:UMF1 family MFS transporter
MFSVGCYVVTDKDLFLMVIGNLAGFALGSSQSGARALVGMLSPGSRSAEFFGFWGLFWKLSAALGPGIYGLISSATTPRTAALVNGLFFVAGLIGLCFVDIDEGRRVAAEADRRDREAAVPAQA